MSAAHDPIAAAEGVLAARVAEVAAAQSALAAAERAEQGAREASESAVDRAEQLATAQTTATRAAYDAERSWSADQTPARWSEVETTRAAREQAAVRASSAVVAAEGSAADLAIASRRVAVARSEVTLAQGRHQRATDALAGVRANRATADEEEAARVGAQLREAGAFEAARATFGAEALAASVPSAVRYVSAALELHAAFTEFSAGLEATKSRAAALEARGRESGAIRAPAHDLALNAHAVHLLGISVHEAFKGRVDGGMVTQRLSVAGQLGSCTDLERRIVEGAVDAVRRAPPSRAADPLSKPIPPREIQRLERDRT